MTSTESYVSERLRRRGGGRVTLMTAHVTTFVNMFYHTHTNARTYLHGTIQARQYSEYRLSFMNHINVYMYF